MKYALLVYDEPSSWQNLTTEQKRARHREYHAAGDSPGVVAHYRLRAPQRTTTVRIEGDETVKAEGLLAETRENLRAIYIFESDEQDSVLELAARIPAVRTGGTVEVWPLTET